MGAIGRRWSYPRGVGPLRVIGAIAPTTNPTETIICNGIGMLSAGNAVVFNAHPSAKRVSAFAVSAMNEAAVRAGGPANLICCTAEPTIESAQELMPPNRSPFVVTGGPGVVKAAMKTGKKVIAGGAGNPPCVVDETADLAQAGEGIVKGFAGQQHRLYSGKKSLQSRRLPMS